MTGLILSMALMGQFSDKVPTATYTSVVTITQPRVVLMPPGAKPSVLYGVLPGTPLTGYSVKEEWRTGNSVYTRQELTGPPAVVQLKRGLLGRSRIVK